MKKISGIFMALFLMSSVSFAFVSPMNCAFWGYHQANAEQDAYGEMTLAEFDEAHGYYQGLCEDAGGAGNISDPAFL